MTWKGFYLLLFTLVAVFGLSEFVGANQFISGGGGSSISGLTTNVIPKATSATAIEDSSMTDNGTTISTALNYTVNNGQGMMTTAGNRLFLSGSGALNSTTARVEIRGDNLATDIHGMTLGFGPANDVSDTFFTRDAAAILQMGIDSATPITQTFKGTDGSGTNNVGGTMNLAPGISTGNANPGSMILQGTPPGSTGTVAQTLANVERIVASSAAPTVSACGTTPSAVTGNNGFGRLTTGSGGTLQSCTLTFALPAFASFTSCTCNDETTILLVRATSTTTTLVCDSAVAGTLESDVLTYQCRGL